MVAAAFSVWLGGYPGSRMNPTFSTHIHRWKKLEKMEQLLSAVVIGYFASHIPITIFIDAQAVLPPSLFPALARDFLAWFCDTWRDPLMCAAPGSAPWFAAIVSAELLFQLPFFFVALFAWIARREWLRLPLIFYGAHTATTLVPIYGTLVDAFSRGRIDSSRFIFLAAVYAPYLIMPLFLAALAALRSPLFPGPRSGKAAGKERTA